jgi:hypothetical protein
MIYMTKRPNPTNPINPEGKQGITNMLALPIDKNLSL